MSTTGYLHPGYAESLSEFGSPRELQACGGWILVRHIPGSDHQDAMGCYPLFCCRDWSLLKADVENLSNDFVSLCLVTDPFGDYDEAYLKTCFPDLVWPFKEHFVVDLTVSVEKIVSKHHRYYARKALQTVEVERCGDPTAFCDDWVTLYSNLIERHQLAGLKAFSRTTFQKQLRIPGMVVLRAVHANTTVGAHLWYIAGDTAYSHLAAFSAKGYELMAAYALYWTALQTFGQNVRWLDIGAGAGNEGMGSQGLAFFKRGWATGTRMAYLCGRIFKPSAYAKLTEARCAHPTAYFPAYRHNEMA